MKPAINKRHHQLKSNYSTPSTKFYFPKIPIKQSKKKITNKQTKARISNIYKETSKTTNKETNE